MKAPRSSYVAAAGHEIHVSEWGDAKNPPLVMWHGLARTGRDFDEAAAALADTYFVICPDTIGRGLSSWGRSETDYSYRLYGETAIGLFDHYGAKTARWIGTSMGGLLGMTLAAGVLKDRISHLVVNDAGPDIPSACLDRLASYVGAPPVCDTISELEVWLRKAYTPFGKNSDAYWRRMADTSSRRTDDGRITLHYDPRIASQFTIHLKDLDVWDKWDAVTAPTLLIRGADSDLLTSEVAKEMTRRGPKPRLEIMRGYGHAPTLANDREIALLRDFLAG